MGIEKLEKVVLTLGIVMFSVYLAAILTIIWAVISVVCWLVG